jgi:D-arabinose 1-dehydrogenase-like Zn-dependent alcohol dehydrogenase
LGWLAFGRRAVADQCGDSTLVLLGAREPLDPGLDGTSVAPQHRRVAGSSAGGIAATQGVIDCCALHTIVADVEVIPMQRINEASERMRHHACRTAASLPWCR